MEDHENQEPVEEEAAELQSEVDHKEEETGDVGDVTDVDVRTDATVKLILPEIRKRESTMDSFKQLTQQQPWIPLNIGGRHLADEEASLFDSMNFRYKIKDAARSNHGYFSFMKVLDTSSR